MNLDKRLIRLAQSSRWALAATVGFGFLAGVLAVFQARFLSRVIQQVFLENQALGQVSGLVWALLAVILGRAALAWGSEVSANSIARRVKTVLREQLFRRLLALGPAYARGERTGEITSVAVEGIEALDAYFSQYLPQLALAALTPLTFLAFIFPLDPLSGLVLLVTAPLIPFFMILIGSQAEALTRKQWLTLSRMSAYFLDVMQGLTTLKLLGRSREQAEVVAQTSESFRRATMRVLRVTFLSALALEMLSTLSTAVVAVEIGLRLLHGRLEFEQAFFVLLLAPEFYLPIRMLGTRFHAGMSGVAAARRIFEILEAGEAGQPVEAVSLEKPGNTAPPALEFQNVRFAYPDDRPAVNGVSFRVEAGQTLALVGPSGAGKSTLGQFLLRFLEPQTGQLLVDGEPLSRIPVGAWRERIAWVPQAPYLFHDSIAANIRLGRPEASREQVIRAARQANADEFIGRLPQGYDTVVGERGARLSGGQAQRVALARAFLKDAPLLLLDEASANLDPENEALLQEAMQRLLIGRTALVIAHRLNTVRQADHILVLDEGRVVEAGDHTALMSNRGLYARLASASNIGSEVMPSGATSFPAVNDLSPTPPIAGKEPIRMADQAAAPRPASPLLRLLAFAAPFARLAALSALLGFATIGSSVGLMASSAYIISRAALQPSIAELQVAIVGVRFFGISRGLFRYLERYLTHQVTFRLLSRLRTWFYQALEPLAPARLMRYHSSDLLSRIMSDIESLENFYVRVVAPPLVAVLTTLAVGAFLTAFHPSLALTWLACMVMAGVGTPMLTRRLARETGRRMAAQRSSLSASLVEGVQGMADLLAFGQGTRQLAKVDSAGQALAASQAQMARITGLQAALQSLLAHLGMWLVLVLSIPLVRAGEIEPVYLAVLVLTTITGFEAALPLPLAAQHLENNLEAARRLFEVVDTQPEVQDPPSPLPLPQPGEPGLPFSLEVRGLSYRYPSANGEPHPGAFSLNGIDFHLPQGGRLGIVGSSGAGKSTLVSLLLRFWEYDQGQILLGGSELRCYRQDDLRSSFGVVSQNTFLFNATVRDNLRLARPGANQAEIERAAQAAQVHAFIESLPQGYDTWIGEQGLRLSGGERQRLAVARALLKDPPLLLLDEPTANLDPVTERQMLKAVYTLMQGRTTLLITHRLVGLEAMDEILVLAQGRVVERGRYAELLAAGGLFHRLWYLQNQALAEIPH